MTAGTRPHPRSYPADREVDVALRDGSTVHVRPVLPEDHEAMVRFLDGLSVEARAFRFFTAAADLQRAATAATDVDYAEDYGVVALQGGEIVGHGCFARLRPDRAEVAFAIADRFQGAGIGTALLAHLVAAAEHLGIETFEAVVLPENHRMLEVFRESGLQVAVRTEPGQLQVEMPASLDTHAQEAFAARDKIAAAAGVRHVLEPSSIAIVGVSERKDSIGGTILRNLLDMPFAGPVWVVHPRARSMHGMPVHRSLCDLPERPELVVIAVPAEAVVDVARDAAAAGASALVVVAGGFGEAGPEGQARERELLEICRTAGIRMVGPNGLGVINTDPDVRLDASFAPRLPEPGNVALLSQSGALGIAAIETSRNTGIGLSSFISIGNKADLSGNDFLQFWQDDERTETVMLYLESFGNPRKFARIAQSMGRNKPLIVVKAGRTHAGARAAQSHTGALLASSDATVDALFTQAGVIRVETLSELFDVGALLSRQQPPRGPRVGIVTNGGGIGILCADACEAGGLDVVRFSAKLQRALGGGAGPATSVGNPVDVLGSGSAEDLVGAAAVVARSGEVDSLIVLTVGTPAADPDAVAAGIDALSAKLRKPVTLATVLMPLAILDGDGRGQGRVPRYAFPEQAAKAVARAARHGAWRAAPPHVAPQVDPAVLDEGAAIIAAALADGAGWLPPEDTERLLELHGIPFIEQRMAADPAAARAAAEELGGTLVLKAVAPQLLHKIDAGAVELGLLTPDEVEDAALEMEERLAGNGFEDVRFMVQRMVSGGVELLAGAVHDPTFGPVVVCAAGGTTAELLKDSATRIAPLDRAQAAGMLRELRTYQLLRGYRGAPPADLESLEKLVVALSELADAHAEIAELDLNPVIAGPGGAVAVDARIRVEAAPEAPPAPSLQADWP